MSENTLFKKAFNAGYLIEKYLPQLSKLLKNNLQDSQNTFAQGFLSGSQEMVSEKSRFISNLKDFSKSDNLSPDKTKSRGYEEPDKDY